MMGRVYVVGSLNVDLVTRVAALASPGETVRGTGLERNAGGKGGNQAMAARGAGAEVVMVGCVGADDGGAAYLSRLKAADIDCDTVRVVEGEVTGHALITVDDQGENAIVVIPGANAAVASTDLERMRELRSSDVLLVQLEIPLPVVADAVRRAVAAGARIVLNAAPYADLPPDVLLAADPVVTNETEAAHLRAAGRRAGSLLVTSGALGAEWRGSRHTPPRVAEVVDTTGAGDAFCGALAAALAAGASDRQALELAVAAGADAVTWAGAQPDPSL